MLVLMPYGSQMRISLRQWLQLLVYRVVKLIHALLRNVHLVPPTYEILVKATIVLFVKHRPFPSPGSQRNSARDMRQALCMDILVIILRPRGSLPSVCSHSIMKGPTELGEDLGSLFHSVQVLLVFGLLESCEKLGRHLVSEISL